MKNTYKYYRHIFLFCLTLTVLLAPAFSLKVQAAKPILAKPQNTDYFASNPDGYMQKLVFRHLKSDAVVEQITVSNSRIARPLYYKDKKIYFTPIKPGKCTIKCLVYQDGNVYRVSKKITIYGGYPFQSLLLNGKQHVDLKGMTNHIRYNSVKPTMQVRYRLKPGWTTRKLSYAYVRNGKIGKKIKFDYGAHIKIVGETAIFLDMKDANGHNYHLLITINLK